MMIDFTIPGKPQGKGRPRFDGRRGVAYTPQKTRDYEDLVRSCYLKNFKGCKPLQGALVAEIIAYYPIPKSAKKSDREAMLEGKIKPKVKPDLDNIIKAVLDALNGYAYKDDAAVVGVRADKRYSQNPCVYVRIYDEDDFPD